MTNEAERLAIELLAPVEDFADPTQLEVEVAALLLKLQAENEALRSENETLRVDGDIIINRLAAENNILHMELDAAMVDAGRYRSLKTRNGYLLVTRLIGAKGYSSSKANEMIDSFADAAVAEVSAFDSLSDEQKTMHHEALLKRAEIDAMKGETPC